LLFREVEIAWRTYLPQHLNATMGLSLAATGWIRDRVEPRHGRRKPIQHHAEAGHGVGASGNLWLISLSGFDTQSLFLPTGARLAVGIEQGCAHTLIARRPSDARPQRPATARVT